MVAACLMGSMAADAREVMQDRCKQDVAFVPVLPNVPTAEARPGTPGTVILRRRSDGSTDWSNIFQTQLLGGGYVRWWCYTGSGTGIEPGVWKVNATEDGNRCLFSDVIDSCSGDSKVKRTASTWEHWTAERSRCGDRSTHFRARLGTGRSLQIECMGR